jgi:hypothetical protein
MMRLLILLLSCLSACTADVFIGPDPTEDDTSSTSEGDTTSGGSTSKGTDKKETTSDSTGKMESTSDSGEETQTTSDSSDKSTTTKTDDDSTTSDTKGSSTDKDQLDCPAPDDWDCIEQDASTSLTWAP